MNEETGTRIPGADVLVVDDDERNRRLLEDLVTAQGHRVRCASSGAEALRKSHEVVPDLVLLDVMMPGMNGFETCRALKSHPCTRLSQVMMVTALDGTEEKVTGLDGGADDYVTKPIRRDEFLAKMRSLLRVRRLLLELEDARATVSARNRRLQELEAMKETLTQTLVHDLKNPLAAVLGGIDLLAMQSGDERQIDLLQRCRANAQRIHRMVMDMLDIAGLEEGRLKLRRERVEPGPMLAAAVEACRIPAAGRSVRLADAAVAPGTDVDADASVLRRVVDNLLANAIEHSPPEGEVRIEIRGCDEGVELSVSDQGPGVPPEYRDRVFEKYARLELNSSGVSNNRGLGLTFCRLAVEAHGGSIWVEEAEGGGARFVALLPAWEEGESSAAGIPA